ncbi:signal transduction histidine kinase [Planomicrobium stackebrandtii]|uniref:histidine kinase n=1 Tax=Planomicrobium stackebrandtii TaxID=253160 RepID=A0ABU0GZF7_9BACL|nr:sensor histidine kinase [Planomicrobium stackebrandtii]MDQ0430744.1 signal transduction histidine kinase [Planomicrobium stackebrandtii]
MRSYWFWLVILGASWTMGLIQLSIGINELSLHILGSALFFGLFFLMPLVRRNPFIAFLNLLVMAILTILIFWPQSESALNPFPLMVFTIIAGKAVYRLSGKAAAVIGVVVLAGALLHSIAGNAGWPPLFLLLYGLVVSGALIFFKKSYVLEEELQERNEALLSEYRKMKRRLLTDEQAARQEERTQIARDIHDSVGHKLTALLMQLEVFRLQADGDAAEHLQDLKSLAKESLEETRSAVKTLKHDEAGGVTAIIGLIRKLEAESFLRIQFSVKHGALSAPLGNDQMVIVYRAVQEALTNVMRHSQAREADIVFEAPGSSIFRFTVSNKTVQAAAFREGFGLASMRERIEQAGGECEAGPENGLFIVKGSLPLIVKESGLE